jgi:O-antigen/teichoic acid export membrane protein
MVIWWFYMTSILPSLSKGFKELKWKEIHKNSENTHNVSELQHLISVSFKILFTFAFAVFSLGILFRDYIIKIIANDDYIFTDTLYNSSDAFLIVFWVILFYFVSLVFIYTLVAAEKQSKLLRINIVITIFNIVGNIILIPKYSFIWAGITTILSQILLCILGYYYTNKLVPIKLPIFFILKVIFFWSLVYLLWYYLLHNFL